MTRSGQTRDPLPSGAPSPVWVRVANEYRPAEVSQSEVGQAFNCESDGTIRVAGFTGDDPLFIREGNDIRPI